MECHKFNNPEIQAIAESYGYVYAGVLNNTPNEKHVHIWCQVRVGIDGKPVIGNTKTEEELIDAFSALL